MLDLVRAKFMSKSFIKFIDITMTTIIVIPTFAAMKLDSKKLILELKCCTQLWRVIELKTNAFYANISWTIRL